MTLLSNLVTEAQIAARSVADYVSGTGLRLGVTGLSRAGKTVFITSLVHNLTQGGRLPVFRASADGRLTRATLQAQPDDAIPRFAYEDHLASLTIDRTWPESTRRISELRLHIAFERRGSWRARNASLTIDIIDYPGEWLLDLPLIGKSFAQWSRETLDASAASGRATLAAAWRGGLQGLAPDSKGSEQVAREQAERFTAYLRAARQDRYALSTLPPGRFLMPGDLEGSPALTFAPLPVEEGRTYGSETIAAMMERRYESYKTHVIRPFFRDHFSRLDRQIVLVDALSALNSGPSAVRDLQTALSDVMQSFRAGRSSLLSTLFRPRIDKILFAATKADHLHHTSHDRLEAILRVLTARAIARAEDVGAKIDVIALAAVRATREGAVRHGNEVLDAIIGTPLAGEEVDGEIFDGSAEGAIFPGELPADPRRALRGDALAVPESEADYRFVRFRPPVPQAGDDGLPRPLPHIRLDRALQFLLGDKLE
ncbi:YcjX family GTP-binding protein [Lichenifustis flavocetrariae]|uniref:YcjX family protein n=1 Tax=Lichenifustis flavocetrariae TaxID=2949735 RepID=A0AA41YQ46_9HYPH|nr:YcjX family protein [Lichenifustis flavocetrariae]MCW6506471.1 YcjX family protein [Lichenifustis flavocetrariae]